MRFALIKTENAGNEAADFLACNGHCPDRRHFVVERQATRTMQIVRDAGFEVIGVDTSEFLVSAAASVGFLLALGREVVSLPVVLALLGGGLVAAPIAAWLVRRVQPHLLGVSVGGLLVLTNARTLLTAAGAPGPVRATALVAVLVVWVAAVGAAHRRHRRAGLALVSTP